MPRRLHAQCKRRPVHPWHPVAALTAALRSKIEQPGLSFTVTDRAESYRWMLAGAAQASSKQEGRWELGNVTGK